MACLKPRNSSGKIMLEKLTKEAFAIGIAESRASQGENSPSVGFNNSRCKILSKSDKILDGSKGILYWMSRDCRTEDNWAMLFAQRLALKNKLPFYVCFTCFEGHHLYPTRRQQTFLIDGLKFIEQECKELDIPFYLLKASPKDISKIVKINNIGGVVCDFSPLRKPRQWTDALLKCLPQGVSLIQVDAHNIVPVWEASPKQEVMAKTLRPKVTKRLAEFLSGFPKMIKHPHPGKMNVDKSYSCTFREALDSFKTIWDVEPVKGLVPGSRAAYDNLYSFLSERLKYYGVSSNDPSKNHTSNLSFWIHFGHISAQRIALEVKSIELLHKEQAEKYLEELIVRKELAENYCFYNENYDNIEGAAGWAKSTLLLHKTDKRTYTYSREQFEKGATHDEIWNAAQNQLHKDGKVHGYMRMYWCKKVLEWTESPEQAIEYALWLNDTFALDGSDPNGFVGVMWSICGVHDQGWKEREIFGKIRFMVDYSLRKKYDIDTYCARYGIVPAKPSKKKGIKRKISS